MTARGPSSTGSFYTGEGEIIGEIARSIVSVAIDIGSATTNVAFSSIDLVPGAGRYTFGRRSVLWQSPVMFTPYRDDANTIDGERLGAFIEEQYRAADLKRADVDVGAVILTGAALERENARTIGDLFASEGGKFVSVAAGDSLEATLCAYGSGAVALSEAGDPVLSIDVGGATTKLAFCRDGKVESVAALNVGSRAIVRDTTGAIDRLGIDRSFVEQLCGAQVSTGLQVDERTLSKVASALVGLVVDSARGHMTEDVAEQAYRTTPLVISEPVKTVIVSGGVAEYCYEREAQDFGDLGKYLGAELRSQLESMGANLVEGWEGIRATAIGVGQFMIQVSSSTVYLSDQRLLPLENVPVTRLDADLSGAEVDERQVEEAVKDALARVATNETSTRVAMAVRWEGSAEFARIDAFCRGLSRAVADMPNPPDPLVLVCNEDIGGILGSYLEGELHVASPVVAIDGVEVRDFEFVDIGRTIDSTRAIPVQVKSLLFRPSRQPGSPGFGKKRDPINVESEGVG